MLEKVIENSEQSWLAYWEQEVLEYWNLPAEKQKQIVDNE